LGIDDSGYYISLGYDLGKSDQYQVKVDADTLELTWQGGENYYTRAYKRVR
jgi:hypothetical protein